MKIKEISMMLESSTGEKTTQRSGVRRIGAGARWLAAAVLAVSATAVQAQSFSLYDDFSAGAIDPTRWSGASFGATLESAKLVTAGTLLLGNITYGEIGPSGGRRTGTTGVELIDTGGVGNLRGLGASVTMLGASSSDCATNTSTGRARMQIRGIFFNDGASSGPGDSTGDIAGGIQTVSDSNGNNFIEWFTFRCDDPTCDASTDLDFANMTTGWSAGLPNFLFVLWDPDNDRFIFAADSEVVASSYTQADAAPPTTDSFPPNLMRARHTPENCAAGAPPSSVGFANIDNVFIATP